MQGGKNEIIYVALDGLIYTEYIHTLAQFMIADINHLASERYEITEDFPFVVLFDDSFLCIRNNR